MNKKEIAAQILKAEILLKELREKLNQPETIKDFKLGDVFDTKAKVPLIVVARYEAAAEESKLFFVVGNDNCYGNYLRPYSDCEKGFTRKEMIRYLNERIESGWFYVGNISEKFDAAVKELLGEK